MSAPPRIKAGALAALEGVSHGFFGRAGGVSNGFYASLNVGRGSDDDPRAVEENRARCAIALGVAPAGLISARQVHSPRAVVARAPWTHENAPEADAIATDAPGLAIGVLAADCMPYLFVDAEARVVGAAHAGWRGALAGVLEACVDAMSRLGAKPERIKAALGPCLRQPNFEVGLELLDAFTQKHPESARFFAPGARPEKRQLDLAGFGRWRLAARGVEAVEDVDVCTLAAPEDWFSHRASKRAGDSDYGRNLSAIALHA